MKNPERIFLLAAIFCCNIAISQDYGPIGFSLNGQPDIAGGMPINQNVPTKQAITYETVREADVIWSKRTWERIDLREKINHPMYFPFEDFDSDGRLVTNNSRISLWNIIRWNILYGNLTIFSPYNPYQYSLRDGDQLKYPILSDLPGENYQTDSVLRDKMFYYIGNLGPQSFNPLQTRDGEDSTRWIDNDNFEFVYPARDTSWIMSKDIVEYRLKEDWFFDKERSVLDVRIIALAPVIYDRDQYGQITGEKELFWLYFPQCRLVFNNYYTYNTKNDALWMSFDDLFWKRRFNATVYKESNVYDRQVESYKHGSDALYESEKIKTEIRNVEHNVWSF